MKSTLFILATSLLTIGFINAEGEEKKRDGQKVSPDRGSLMSQIDTNGDKAISREEAGDRWERLSQLDKNNDGKVTAQELLAVRQGGKGDTRKGRLGEGGKGKGEPGAFLKRMDKNSDGALTPEEVPELLWARLSMADSNNDGKVTFEEARANNPERPGGGEFFKRADQNNDGKISKDEVPAEAWERLGKLDKNNDGAVSKEEIVAMAGGSRGSAKGNAKVQGKSQHGGPDAIFGKMDKNGDDKLSKDEVPDEMWAKLRNADEDTDGTVSRNELQKSYRSRY